MVTHLEKFLLRRLVERRRRESSPEYAALYRFFEPQLQQVASTYFPENGPVVINHQGLFKNRPDLKGGFIPARDYLTEAGAPQTLIDAVFTPEGQLKEVKPDGKDVWNVTSADDAAYYISQWLKDVDKLAQISVDASLPTKFNRHKADHQADVYFEAASLLFAAQPYRKDITPQTYVDTAIDALSHDRGLLLSRGDHSILSVVLLKHFIPGIEKNPRFLRAAASIIAHDPPRLKEYLKSQGAVREDGSILVDKATEIMKRDLPPEALAIIGADRNQFGKRRVPEGLTSPDVFDIDQNIFPNAALESTSHIIDDTYYMNLFFNPIIDPRDMYRWAGRASKRALYIGRMRLHVPSHIHKKLKEEGVPYSITTEYDWLKQYKKDFLDIQVAAIFALNPHLKRFTLITNDPYMPIELSRNGELSQRVHTFNKGCLQKDLDAYQTALDEMANPKAA